MVVCDSCRKEITRDDDKTLVTLERIPGGWMRDVARKNDIVLCPDCDKSVMNFIRNRTPREECR